METNLLLFCIVGLYLIQLLFIRAIIEFRINPTISLYKYAISFGAGANALVICRFQEKYLFGFEIQNAVIYSLAFFALIVIPIYLLGKHYYNSLKLKTP